MAQYQAWLNTNPSTAGQVAGCAWNTDFTPGSDCGTSYNGTAIWPPTAANANYPVECVNWCDAYSYCAAAGKRLCGKIGGGTLDYTAYRTTPTGQWYSACTSNGTYTSSGYTYGNTYNSTNCNGTDYWGGLEAFSVVVGSMGRCQSPVTGYVGVYDLTGNVFEWIDSCDGTSNGKTDHCNYSGGAYNSGPAGDYMSCGSVNADYRAAEGRGVGIRCCSP